MSVQIQNITRTRGDTYPFTVTFRDSSGNLLDLTGASFVLTVSEEEDPDSTQASEFSLNGVVVAPTTGVVEFTLTASDADRVGRFFYDIQMTDAQGYIRTMMRGTFTMIQDISKNKIVWAPWRDLQEGTAITPASSPTAGGDPVSFLYPGFTVEVIEGRKVAALGEDSSDWVTRYDRPHTTVGHRIDATVYLYDGGATLGLFDVVGYGVWLNVNLDLYVGSENAAVTYSFVTSNGAYYEGVVNPVWDTTAWEGVAGFYVVSIRLDSDGLIYASITAEGDDDDWKLIEFDPACFLSGGYAPFYPFPLVSTRADKAGTPNPIAALESLTISKVTT